MASLILGLAALAGFSSALDVKVANMGGNATSGMQYGIMFEVHAVDFLCDRIGTHTCRI